MRVIRGWRTMAAAFWRFRAEISSSSAYLDADAGSVRPVDVAQDMSDLPFVSGASKVLTVGGNGDNQQALLLVGIELAEGPFGMGLDCLLRLL